MSDGGKRRAGEQARPVLTNERCKVPLTTREDPCKAAMINPSDIPAASRILIGLKVLRIGEV